MFVLLCRVLTLAASSEEEKDKWLEDLTVAIDNSKMLTTDEISYLSLKSCSEFSLQYLFKFTTIESNQKNTF